MEDITNSFGTYFDPICALVFYQGNSGYTESYVEYFDMKNGLPINPHPITVLEGQRLATALQVKEENMNVLRSDGILPNNLLSFDAKSSAIVWFTKAGVRELFFDKNLGIQSGKAHIPPLVWIADRKTLHLYALSSNRKPTLNTPLLYAPFFNVYQNGSVCMGTVDIATAETGSVNELMMLWENYFFNSYFSHLMSGHNPVNGNCVMLWENLIGTGKSFPSEMLLKTTKKLKDIL
ncbi:PRTRC system protein B [Chryseobacterium camelliae]|uniref:PRTRC system protein B n=1 Tax=Chryseobacterium camelliae TaxID=1265445 RepID=UPI002864315B|nr:PRTRC system protein B [Chryseobacterium camelliae]MDR6513676.1 PRTRC genetic system protein B [Chryseobacterium camelliae]